MKNVIRFISIFAIWLTYMLSDLSTATTYEIFSIGLLTVIAISVSNR